MTQTETRNPAKREQMLLAARALFLAQGYGRTSTDALARAAGVSKQTLYVYFPGKADLLAAVVARELDTLDGGQAPPLPQDRAGLRALLLAFARGVTGRLLDPDALALLRLLIGEAAHLPELRPLLQEAVPLRLLGRVGALLTAARARGLVQTPDPDLSARMFVGPLMSYVLLDGLFGTAPPAPPPEATLARLVDLCLLSLPEAPPGGDPT